ncbi:hypothetical protein [Nocardiopsis trehalosi]|jgi:hypothetical protein|uniref:hypothetical protein n=1 Tax=Nocardiopsis trehalosi TaxID=109329 RepID=UPI0008361D9E|nr:hypothetical protein [Nocardiopsis trehalosi]
MRVLNALLPYLALVSRRDDRGSHTTEFIIGITIVVGIATVVGAVLMDTFTGAAESIDLGLAK